MSKPTFMVSLQIVGTDIKFTKKLRSNITNIEANAHELSTLDWEKFIKYTLEKGGGTEECIKEWNKQYAKVVGHDNHWSGTYVPHVCPPEDDFYIIPKIPIEEGADELIDEMCERLGMNKIEYIEEDK